MFSQAVIEKIGSYVYFLRDPKTKEVFYVGKGEGNRVFDHVNCAIEDTSDNDKLEKIREIGTDKVEHFILRHGLKPEQAFLLESCVIDFAHAVEFIGKMNLRNIQLGHGSSELGLQSIHEIINKYDNDPLKSLDKLLLIKINRYYKRDMSAEDIYKFTSYSWRINMRRANNATYVLSVANGIVRAVYTDLTFHSVENEKIVDGDIPDKDKGRVYFKGREVNDSPYIGKSTRAFGEKGQANPIRYLNI